MSHPSETPARGGRDRFVTLCQQMLALAVVVAVLTPAARTVTMDVRPAQPVDIVPTEVGLRSAAFPSQVPTGPVDVEVEEFALTAPAKAVGRARAAVRATARTLRTGGQRITSQALPVDGYGTVGVTWSAGDRVADDAIGVKVRTRTGRAWSDWTKVEYHDEHGPDPRSPEARTARPGTDPLLIGTVDAVQVKVATRRGAPADMKLAIIDPGKAAATTKETPAIDTGRLAGRTGTASTTTGGTADPDPGAADPATDEGTDPATDEGTDGTETDVELQAATFTPRPRIFSRAQWGADERLRDRGSLSYYEVHAGFVHHTVNANDYTADQVPGIIRGIYSYHTRSRGWSDIGYNFLVDRWGRIWEGRFGGVDRPVVGAHTSGYNQYAFAMSAIGNFETARPTSRMVNAYGALMAWKLSLHGVNANSLRQRVGSKVFPAINGHRDAGSTACPGRYLYAQLPTIRSLATKAQRGWSGRELLGNYRGSAKADVLTRRTTDGHLVIQEVTWGNGRWRLAPRYDTGIDLRYAMGIHRAGDWDRDGYDDFFAQRASDRALLLYRGRGGGHFHPPTVFWPGLGTMQLFAAVGDVTGDGWPDLMGQRPGKAMRIYPGRGVKGLRPSYAAYSGTPGSRHVPVGRWNPDDGAPDSMVLNSGQLTLYYGNGPGGWTRSSLVSRGAGAWDWIVGLTPAGTDRVSSLIVRVRSTKQVFLIPRNGVGFGKPVHMNYRKNYDLIG